MDKYKKYEPIFGSWKISKLIGKGSFGNVYEIVREEYGTTYKSALKVISVPQDDDDIKTRMTISGDLETLSEYYEGILKEIINENEIMSKLKGNSNIVSYEDHQIIPHDDGIGYDILIRMELLTPLLDRMLEKKLEEKDVVKLGIDICKALELCHKKKIIHRDIKPQNIFISDSGDYKLGDFGIARTMEKTTDGMSKKGTYRYMAPEVFRGDEYNSTVDIYSLGIVLYSLLNGNRGPFLPPPPAKITHNDEEEARNRRFKGEEIPEPKDASKMLALIIKKACAADPSKRYATAKEMRRDLESYYDNYYSANAKGKPALREEKSENVAAATAVTAKQQSQAMSLNNYAGARVNKNNTYNNGAPVYSDTGVAVPQSSGNSNNKKTVIAAVLVGVLIFSILLGGIAFLKGKGDGGDNVANNPLTNEAGGGEGGTKATDDEGGMKTIADVQGVKITNFEYDWDSAVSDSVSGIHTVDAIYRVTNESGRPIIGIEYEASSAGGEPITDDVEGSSALSAFGYIPNGKSGVMVGKLNCKKKNLKPDGGSFKVTSAYVNDSIQNYTVPTGEIIEHVGGADYYNVSVTNNNDTEVSKDAVLVAINYSDGKITEADATGRLSGPIPPGEQNYKVVEAFSDPHFKSNNEELKIYVIDTDYYKNAGQ